jgi:hypothetical protein
VEAHGEHRVLIRQTVGDGTSSGAWIAGLSGSAPLVRVGNAGGCLDNRVHGRIGLFGADGSHACGAALSSEAI